MNDLSRQPSRRLSRSERERRAYRLTLATGATGLATVVTLVLSIFGAVSFGIVIILALLTALLGYFLKRTLGV